VTFLIQLPGISTLSALTILAAIGEIERFETPKKLVGYAGLGAGVHASGQTHRGGHITKQGRKDLRWVMVQAAWAAVGHYPFIHHHLDQLGLPAEVHHPERGAPTPVKEAQAVPG